MKRFLLIALTGVAAATLTACSSESPDPVEQIIVREPGEVAAPATSEGTATTDILAAGSAAFAACASCHSVEAGEPSGAGPNLHGVVGRPAGSLDDFAYSEAMSASSLVWNEGELDAFLANPTGGVPGTSMVAGGVDDAEQREAIIAYLASLSE